METSDSPIIVLGISSRSGTNFLYGLLNLHPDVDIASPVQEDFLLFGAHHLRDYVAHVSRRWDMDWGMSPSDSDELLRTLGRAGLDFLKRRQKRPELRLLTKTPEVHNLLMFPELFPTARLIIIVRDGRAMVESKVNSFDVAEEQATKNWADAAQLILDFDASASSDSYRIIKYEELYLRPHKIVKSLLGFLELDPTAYPFEEIDNLPVRGSSVFHGQSGQLDWEPVEKTAEFKPLERFAHWTDEQHRAFNLVAGGALKRLGYQPNESLYVKADLSITPHDQTLNLVTRLDNGEKMLMPVESSRLLENYNRYLSLHDYFKACFLKPTERPKFIDFTETCYNAGFLMSSEHLLEKLGSAKGLNNGTPPEKSPPELFIRTCDRPVYLERLLASLPGTGNAELKNIYVLDDSRSLPIQSQNADVVVRMCKVRQENIHYLGSVWQAGFIQQLSHVFPEYEGVIRYLLEGRENGVFSAGRLINFAMLAFAGRPLLTYDDDYVLDQAWQHPEVDNASLCITNERAHCLEGFQTESDLLHKSSCTEINPVQAHLGVLGCELSGVLSDPEVPLPRAVSLHGLSQEFSSQLGPESPVLTTSNGVMGQPISPDGSLAWFADGEYTVPVWAKSKSYEAWMSGQHIYASFKHTSLLPSTFGMPAGIDNSYLMPPTIPAGKREDSLFTFLLHGIHHASLHLEFPWAISHKRETRDWRSKAVEQPVDVCLAQLILSMLSTHVSSGEDQGSPETRLIMLGAALTDKGTLSDERLRAAFSKLHDNMLSTHCQRLRRALDREDLRDPQVVADLEQALKVNMDALTGRSQGFKLEDAHFPDDEKEQLKLVRQELMLFGQALLIWPVLWKYCAENPDLVHEVNAVTGSQEGAISEEFRDARLSP